jgi:hypothetical protein
MPTGRNVTTPSPHDDVPHAHPVSLAQRPVEEDLYCLSCGYNVRGLTGNPVRCPECGDENERAALRLPAPLIKAALRKMETVPTACVGTAVIGYLFGSMGLLIWLLEERRVLGTRAGPFVLGCLVVTGICAVLWPVACVHMRRSFDAQPGWTRVLGGFHLAGFLLTLYYPLLLAWAMIVERVRDPSGMPPRGIGWIVLVLSVAAAAWGLRVYDVARRRLARMRRDAAVKIASNVLHEARARAR